MAGAASTFTIEIEVDPGNAAAAFGQLSSKMRGQFTGIDTQLNKVDKALAGTSNQAQRFTQNLSTQRYALYDVSRTLGVMGAALLGAAVATSAVAIAWERDFAQVIRTTGVTGDAVGELRGELVDLAQTMPVAFGDLAQIATLAGQLGVAENRVASFTETVAKFSAVTDLTVDAAATAFGRLDALLPDVQGNYEALGSSIAKVGVESVATESQIVNTAVQISSMGAFAGLTADQVVGLSGALASIGVAPELARGTITRVFVNMSKAVADGGDKLEGFAKIAGVSSDTFASSFGTAKFGPIFQSFIEGLNDTARTGGNAVAALDELGITSVRDVPALLRLANAGTLLGDSFTDAANGFKNATELNRQYGIIADTAAAQIQRLVNSVMSLFDAIGSASLGPLTDSISFLADAFANLADFASEDFVAPFVSFGAAMTALTGVLALAGAGLALFGASSIAMSQGFQALVLMAPRASAAILGAGTASAIASGEMKAATVSAKLFGAALKILSIVGIALVLPDIGKWAADTAYNLKGLNTTTSESVARMKELFEGGQFAGNRSVEQLDSFTAGIMRMFAALDDGDLKAIKIQDEEFTASIKAGGQAAEYAAAQYNGLARSWKAGGGDVDAFKALYIDTTAALEGSRNATSSAAGGLEEIEAAAEAAQGALDELRDAILHFNDTSINAEEAEIAFKRGLQEIAAGVNDVTIGLDGSNDASLDFIQSLIDMDKAARDSAVAVLDNGGSIEEAMGKYNAARDAIINARIAKGEDADAAAAWADRVLGTAAEAQHAIETYGSAVNNLPPAKDTKITNSAVPAGLSLSAYIRQLESIPPTKYTTIVTLFETRGAPYNTNPEAIYKRASGGPIFGPGSGTSDSIPAWLSNGEYVIKAAAVQKYGMGFMNALNSGRIPRFAHGGSVSAAPAQSSPIGSVVELGPKSLARISQNVTNNILLDDAAISRSAQRGDKIRRFNGDI